MKKQIIQQLRLSMINDKVDGETLGEFHIGDEQFVIKIKKSPLNKCLRCWRYLADNENSLCDRCEKVING
jgi:isoleucyl-tRNA synthetase